jgi:ankyrin repeat protein
MRTPLSFAVYAQKQPLIELLARFSRDIWSLVITGNVTRLHELLHEQPALAKAAHPEGDTPLMHLPDDEEKAVAIVRLFLEHGADPTVRNRRGQSAADLASRRGLEEAAALLITST